jgi:molecular chaperone GrpE (heat shock protein)
MNAIDLEESEAVPDGTVLEVYRSGYEWNGEVFRPAQVKVSRAPAKVQQV